jgi:SinI restriction endonuclease
MEPTTTFDEYAVGIGLRYGKETLGNQWNTSIEAVLTVALGDIRNMPRLGFRTSPIPFRQYIEKWVSAYQKGYASRPSIKTGKPGGTAPDVIIGYLLQAKLPNLDQERTSQIVQGHSLLMSVENLVGQLLEEYLALKLIEDGWYCGWGSTLDAVDFCKADGSLLQVKTSDNSENSSSSRVRQGTIIQKWQRRNSKKPDAYYWAELNQLVGRTDLSEADFRAFATNVVRQNPGCFHIPDDSPLRDTD